MACPRESLDTMESGSISMECITKWIADNITGILIGLVTSIVVSLFVAYLFHRANKRPKKITYTIDTQPLVAKMVTDTISGIPGLAVTYENEPVTNLSATTICFTNTGNGTIHPREDFATEAPLIIETDGKILAYDMTMTGDKTKTRLFLEGCNNNKIRVDFEYWKVGTKTKLVLFHTERKIEITKESKDVKIQKISGSDGIMWSGKRLLGHMAIAFMVGVVFWLAIACTGKFDGFLGNLVLICASMNIACFCIAGMLLARTCIRIRRKKRRAG